jgi:hypothetical protein
MQRVQFIVDQLEESKRLIQLGSLSQIRIALILLDNASEVLMYRAIQMELEYHDMNARLLGHAQNVMSPEELDKFRLEMGYEPLSQKSRKTLLREYDSKVDYLSKIKSHRVLSPAIGAVLKVTHRYRNEAYHRDKIRKETLSPVVLVLFDMVTDLLEILQPGLMSFSSEDNWGGFCEKYGLAFPPFGIADEGLSKIVISLKIGMSLDMAGIRNSLSNHLISRIEGMESSLQSLSEKSGARLSSADELRRVQFWTNHGYVPQADDHKFQTYVAGYSMDILHQWKTDANMLREENDRLDLFRRFSALEGTMEPLENRINEAATSLDSAIQLAIDIARGK